MGRTVAAWRHRWRPSKIQLPVPRLGHWSCHHPCPCLVRVVVACTSASSAFTSASKRFCSSKCCILRSRSFRWLMSFFKRLTLPSAFLAACRPFRMARRSTPSPPVTDSGRSVSMARCCACSGTCVQSYRAGVRSSRSRKPLVPMSSCRRPCGAALSLGLVWYLARGQRSL